MKEDIKILLYLIEYFKRGYTIGKGINEIEITEENINSLENIAKAYKEDEAVIEEMAEYIGNLDIDEDICKKRIDDCYADIFDDKLCKDCVEEYFRNKAKEKKNEGN